ncbi:HAD family hydrolase [Pseudomonas sp. XS1P51]
MTVAIRQLGRDLHPPSDIQSLFGVPMHHVVAQLLKPFSDDRITHCLELYRAHYRQYRLYNSPRPCPKPLPGCDWVSVSIQLHQ